MLESSAHSAAATVSVIFKNLVPAIDAATVIERYKVLGATALREQLERLVDTSGRDQRVGGADGGHNALDGALHLAEVHSSYAKLCGMLLSQRNKDCNM